MVAKYLYLKYAKVINILFKKRGVNMHNKYFFDNFYMLQKTVKTNRKKISDTVGNANNSIIQNIFKFEKRLSKCLKN